MMPLIAELNRTRRIGAEYEMSVPLIGTGTGRDVQHTLASILSSNQIHSTSRGYSHRKVEPYDCAIEYDASVRGESEYAGISWFSVEFKSRILNGIADWERLVPKGLDICRYMGARVNKTTGHHLHLSLPEYEQNPKVIRSLANLFHRFEPVIYGLVAPSRLGNSYSRPMNIDHLRSLRRCRSDRSYANVVDRWDRQAGLTFAHINGNTGPRVEFRYHGGTLDPEKAKHWLRFCLQMVEHACTRNCQAAKEQTPNTRRGLENLLLCGFNQNSNIYKTIYPELRQTGKYLIRRWKHFNGRIPLQRNDRRQSKVDTDNL